MMNLQSFPKILAAVGKYADYVVGYDVEVTEKIDGSQFAFGKDRDGKLHMRSKGCPIQDFNDVQKLFRPAVAHVLSIQDRIPNDSAFYCETLCAARHNTLEYERVPRNHLMLFGVTDFSRTYASNDEARRGFAETFEIEAVPLVYAGTLESLSSLKDMLERESVLGKVKIEGVVACNFSQPFEFNGMVVPFAAVKYVSEQFKEKHADNPDWKSQTDKYRELLESYRTDARWNKAIQHLKEAGQLIGEPKDIGILMKELHRDLAEEEQENFKSELYSLCSKEWKGVVTRGFPEYYKQKLLEETNVNRKEDSSKLP